MHRQVFKGNFLLKHTTLDLLPQLLIGLLERGVPHLIFLSQTNICYSVVDLLPWQADHCISVWHAKWIWHGKKREIAGCQSDSIVWFIGHAPTVQVSRNSLEANFSIRILTFISVLLAGCQTGWGHFWCKRYMIPLRNKWSIAKGRIHESITVLLLFLIYTFQRIRDGNWPYNNKYPLKI